MTKSLSFGCIACNTLVCATVVANQLVCDDDVATAMSSPTTQSQTSLDVVLRSLAVCSPPSPACCRHIELATPSVWRSCVKSSGTLVNYTSPITSTLSASSWSVRPPLVGSLVQLRSSLWRHSPIPAWDHPLLQMQQCFLPLEYEPGSHSKPAATVTGSSGMLGRRIATSDSFDHHFISNSQFARSTNSQPILIVCCNNNYQQS